MLAFRSFNFGGAVIQLSKNKQIVVFDTWLHYLPDYMKDINNNLKTADEIIAAEADTRLAEISNILKEIKPYIKSADNKNILIMGDFNSGSHLDWIKETATMHKGYVIEWPESLEMEKAGFKDSYRRLNINPLLYPGFTWSPRAATSSDKYGIIDRIDYIYYQGKGLSPIYSKVIDYHPIMFPSDHAAVITTFLID